MSRIPNNYMRKHLQQLLGKTVTALVVDDTPDTLDDFGEPLWGLKFTDGTVTWIMRDPEGNGPGFMDIMPPELCGTRKEMAPELLNIIPPEKQ